MSAVTAAPAAFGDALTIASEVASGTRSATSVVEQHLDRIADHEAAVHACLLYTSPSPRDQRGSRMPSSA